LTSTDVGGLHRIGLLVKERTGVDLTIFYDGYDRNLFLSGIGMTLRLMAGSIIGSLLLGCLGALVAESGVPWLGGLVRLTVALGRMTPPLLLIYLVFFGLGHIVVSRFGWTFDGSVIAILFPSSPSSACRSTRDAPSCSPCSKRARFSRIGNRAFR